MRGENKITGTNPNPNFAFLGGGVNATLFFINMWLGGINRVYVTPTGVVSRRKNEHSTNMPVGFALAWVCFGFTWGWVWFHFGFALDWIRFDLGSIGVAFNPVCVCFGVDWVWFGCAWS